MNVYHIIQYLPRDYFAAFNLVSFNVYYASVAYSIYVYYDVSMYTMMYLSIL